MNTDATINVDALSLQYYKSQECFDVCKWSITLLYLYDDCNDTNQFQYAIDRIRVFQLRK